MPNASRPRTHTNAAALDVAAVILTVALLSVPRVLADSGPAAGAGSTSESTEVAQGTAASDAVPSGPVHPVDADPLVANRNPFEQLVVPETPSEPEAGGSPEEERAEPSGEGVPLELPEPQEQPPPPEPAPPDEPGASQNAAAPPEPAPPEPAAPEEAPRPPEDEGAAAKEPQAEGESHPGGVGPRTPSTPPPAAAGPEALRLERITVDEEGVHRAHLRLGEQRYTPAKGEHFGDGYRLSKIDPPCVLVVRGDAWARICEDDRVFPK